MTLKARGFATEGTWGGVEREGPGIGKHHRREVSHSPLQQSKLLFTRRAIRIGRGERLLGENVEPSK